MYHISFDIGTQHLRDMTYLSRLLNPRITPKGISPN